MEDLRVRGRAKTAELIALVLALEERGDLEERERRRLDREIGAAHASSSGLELLRAWLAKAPSEELRTRADRVRSSLATLGWLFAAFGFFLGWAAASALLAIEVYAGRINIVLCLAILVLVPFLMLVATGIGWLWSSRRAPDAGPGSLGDWMRSAWLGRLALRLVPQAARGDVEIVFGRMTAHSRLYGGVQRGQLLLWTQVSGLGFGFGALAATLIYVVFTDLAFGWSTTLDVDARMVHRVLAGIAWPWAGFWPDASPTLDLVEATRFFRVEAERRVPIDDPMLFGGWWPFLVMSIAFYLILPRALVLLGLSRWLGGEVAQAMGLTPGVPRLMTRLATPLVETTAEEEEGEVGHAEQGLVPEVDARAWLAERGGESPCLVRWAELTAEAALLERLGSNLLIRDAGGRRSLAEDSAVIDACAGEAGGVALCVRGYEPPVLEVTDFLAELREALGAARPICVFLLDGSDLDRDTWRRKLLGLGDPALSVAHLAMEPRGPVGSTGSAGSPEAPEAPEATGSTGSMGEPHV